MEGQGEPVSSPDAHNLLTVHGCYRCRLTVRFESRCPDEHTWKVAPQNCGLEGALEGVCLPPIRIAVNIGVD